MNVVEIFWIAVIGSIFLGVIALLVIAWAMGMALGQKGPIPQEEWEQMHERE
jgi:hypothetical protein